MYDERVIVKFSFKSEKEKAESADVAEEKNFEPIKMDLEQLFEMSKTLDKNSKILSRHKYEHYVSKFFI